ncbi:hypothetical protein [Thalassobacillus pellis]|uniref:hypothetical protein n=1 Tax=Thalassobacillus pellis TaxID=748008 RepID=UPI0019620D10|nr:hypothetical protein [Thalassobacillus pellis]MBM7554196.1 hypothetical protein [Thalassobacillus pellis]
MPEDRNVHVETTPHFDGEIESIISDPEGKQTGIVVEQSQEFHRHKPRIKLQTSAKMKPFEKMMRGRKVGRD